MKNAAWVILGIGLSFCFGFSLKTITEKQVASTAEAEQGQHNTETGKQNNMKLGAFSVSLSVKDIHASKAFYEKLGFTAFAGDITKNYVIMKNENALIGLFQGMFENNILTFNPGWNENAQNIENFDDVREIQKVLKSKNVALTAEADENTSGPASIMLTDPDGNVIYVDQHR